MLYSCTHMAAVGVRGLISYLLTYLSACTFYCCSLEYTFRTIYWAVFGLKDSKTVELGEGYQSRFTESLGYIVFGVYNWGAVIVLLNMLIAMMTRSFDKIAVSSFSRSY